MSSRIDWTQTPHLQAFAQLAPDPFARFAELEQAIFVDGALSAKIKELIAVAVTHVTQCDGCLRLHVQNARNLGASDQEIAEAVWVAAELRAGAAIGQLRTTMDVLGKASKT